MIRNYMEPTPTNLRALGDGLLAASATITAAAIGNDVDWLAYSALFIGVIGKFLTNMFKKKD